MTEVSKCSMKINILFTYLWSIKRIKENPEVLPLASYYELEQDCQILEFQNYNVVQFRLTSVQCMTEVSKCSMKINYLAPFKHKHKHQQFAHEN
jgi:hypothetical protein